MTSTIHPTAVIQPGAVIGEGCTIGPYCVIGPRVTLGDNCILHSHVVIEGITTVGYACEIFPFASLGHKPQDLKYKGEESCLIIGARNKIREYCTMNPGTSGDRMETRVGDDCLFMMSTHVAHDCIVGNRVILANCATLAGHVVVEDGVVIGGLSAVRQFVRVGKGAMIGGMSAVENDVIPYGMVMGERATLAGLNFVGLERRGVDKATIQILRSAFKDLFENTDGTFAQRVERAAATHANQNLVKDIIQFIQAKAGSALCQPKRETNG
jgi:UDP-N-acetylglucosamine acyltransferase